MQTQAKRAVGKRERASLLDTLRANARAEDERLVELVRSGRGLSTFLSQAPYGIFIASVDGRILSVNPALLAMTGYDESEVLDRHFSFFTTRDKLAETLADRQRLVRGDLGSYQHEKHYIRRDGALIDVRVTVSAIREHGTTVATVAMVQDVTEFKRAARERREMQERLGAVVENVPMALFSFNRDGIFTICEGKHASGARIRPEDFIGRSVLDLYANDPDALEHIRHALAGQAHTSDMQMSDGTWFRVAYVPVLDDAGRVDHVVGAAMNIAKERAAEQARLESEAKSRFLAGISHELRTPLNSILGFSELLSRLPAHELNEKQQRYIANIQASGRHLLSLVNDLLDLHKVAANQLEISVEDIDAGQVIAACIERMSAAAAARRVRVTNRVPAGTCVVADSRRLEQVVLNLLSNAIKFTDGTDARVTLSVRRKRDRVLIRVRDNGIGISEADLSKIFDEFTQADTGHARSHEGTGLGLPLSRRLMELMAGTIEVESREGEGSVFTLTLPAAAGA